MLGTHVFSSEWISLDKRLDLVLSNLLSKLLSLTYQLLLVRMSYHISIPVDGFEAFLSQTS
jgi:hypothetical protein